MMNRIVGVPRQRQIPFFPQADFFATFIGPKQGPA